MAGFYAVFHGPEGLKAIAQRIHRKTARLAETLRQNGFQSEPSVFFDTITVDVGPMQAALPPSRPFGAHLESRKRTRITRRIITCRKS